VSAYSINQLVDTLNGRPHLYHHLQALYLYLGDNGDEFLIPNSITSVLALAPRLRQLYIECNLVDVVRPSLRALASRHSPTQLGSLHLSLTEDTYDEAMQLIGTLDTLRDLTIRADEPSPCELPTVYGGWSLPVLAKLNLRVAPAWSYVFTVALALSHLPRLRDVVLYHALCENEDHIPHDHLARFFQHHTFDRVELGFEEKIAVVYAPHIRAATLTAALTPAAVKRLTEDVKVLHLRHVDRNFEAVRALLGRSGFIKEVTSLIGVRWTWPELVEHAQGGEQAMLPTSAAAPHVVTDALELEKKGTRWLDDASKPISHYIVA
jgi:hypothetical protein